KVNRKHDRIRTAPSQGLKIGTALLETPAKTIFIFDLCLFIIVHYSAQLPNLQELSLFSLYWQKNKSS
ncbi:MAG: hypothetical protein ACLRWQ_08675, partial [Flavonifractor plautii]